MNTTQPATHTPGPWQYQPGSETQNPSIWAGDLLIAQLTDLPEADDYARLIAASPELLEACRDIDRDYSSLGGMGTLPRPLIERVRTAIAKATGASQ